MVQLFEAKAEETKELKEIRIRVLDSRFTLLVYGVTAL